MKRVFALAVYTLGVAGAAMAGEITVLSGGAIKLHQAFCKRGIVAAAHRNGDV